MPAPARRPAAASKSSSVICLLSRGRASGWTVSSPIATSSRPPRRSCEVEARAGRRAAGGTRRSTRRNGARSGTSSSRSSLRHRARVEEIAGVIELDRGAVRHLGPGLLERQPDLLHDRAARRRPVERVPPQVAEDTGERALAAGQEDGERRREPTCRRALLLEDDAERPPRVDSAPRRTQRADQAVLGRERHAGACSRRKCAPVAVRPRRRKRMPRSSPRAPRRAGSAAWGRPASRARATVAHAAATPPRPSARRARSCEPRVSSANGIASAAAITAGARVRAEAAKP